MTTHDSLDAFSGAARDAVVSLLYRLGDDELIIGHRNSEWTGLAPSPEEDVAFSSMAQDELSHARLYYQMLHQLGEPEPDTLAFTRKPREFRCASLVCLPNNRDWAFCVLRQFLYDAAEVVRLSELSKNPLTPLARLAAKLRNDEKYHLMQGRAWVLRLAGAMGEDHRRMQAALDQVYPHALGLFEPTEADEPLAQAGIASTDEALGHQWESAAAPVLAEAGLTVPEAARPVYGGRFGRHPDTFAKLLQHLQSQTGGMFGAAGAEPEADADT